MRGYIEADLAGHNRGGRSRHNPRHSSSRRRRRRHRARTAYHISMNCLLIYGVPLNQAVDHHHDGGGGGGGGGGGEFK